MTTAAVFPGHGPEATEAGGYVQARRPDLHELAIELCGIDPFARARESTRYLQPAVFCTSVAASGELDRPPAMAAGHSLGEFAALVLAGALAADDALGLVIRRGALCADIAEQLGPGGMVAVTARDPGRIAALDGLGAAVAGDNGRGQVVLAGPRAALDAVRDAAAEAGLHASELPVEVPFHTAAMEPAAQGLADALAAVEVAEPAVPVLSCISAKPFADVRSELAGALTARFRWGAVMDALRAMGATRFVELGPGRMLSSLIRRAVPAAEVERLGP